MTRSKRKVFLLKLIIIFYTEYIFLILCKYLCKSIFKYCCQLANNKYYTLDLRRLSYSMPPWSNYRYLERKCAKVIIKKKCAAASNGKKLEICANLQPHTKIEKHIQHSKSFYEILNCFLSYIQLYVVIYILQTFFPVSLLLFGYL